MNEVVKFIAGLGVPGFVLFMAMGLVGWSGAAAITAALAALGGPLGMLGGIALLGVLAYFSQAIAQYGFERIYREMVIELKRQGKSKRQVISEINGYLITASLKAKLTAYVMNHWPNDDEPPGPTTPPTPGGVV